jgi:acetate kinase
MRDLHDATTSNPDARLVIRMFCYSVRKQVAALDGVDLIVVLDEVRNRAVANPISDPASRCAALVLASQEDEQIARHAGTLVANRLTRIDAAEG